MHHYIIVGAGSAGCVLANRLSEDPAVRVLLLEAGAANTTMEVQIPAAFAKLFKSASDWNYTTEPEPELANRRLYWPRGKMLGGSSAMNAQMHVRGNRADFDGWAALGNPGWSYQDVLPYFKRSEHCARGASDYRGASGPLRISDLREINPTTHAFIEAAREVGLERCVDVNAETQEGVDYTQVTQLRGKRCSAATAYLQPVRRRRNLRIVTGAHATRIVVEKGRAVGVEYVANGQKEIARVERELIISGGAVNSPQLLMLSGIGPANQLRAHGIDVVHDLPGVGRNLQDHLATGITVKSKQPITLVAAESVVQLLKFIFLRRGMLTSNVAEACAFVRTSSELGAPDLELIYAPVPFVEHGFVKPEAHGISVGVVLLDPKSVGSITLRSADPFDAPVIAARYLTDEEGHDLHVLLHGLKVARRILDTRALSAYAGEAVLPEPGAESDADLIAFIRARAETLYHPVGTCKMGVDAEAVVDAELRVHGVEGLRIVDASVMPTIVRGHPNAATIMIAEKAADLIRRNRLVRDRAYAVSVAGD